MHRERVWKGSEPPRTQRANRIRDAFPSIQLHGPLPTFESLLTTACLFNRRCYRGHPAGANMPTVEGETAPRGT